MDTSPLSGPPRAALLHSSQRHKQRTPGLDQSSGNSLQISSSTDGSGVPVPSVRTELMRPQPEQMPNVYRSSSQHPRHTSGGRTFRLQTAEERAAPVMTPFRPGPKGGATPVRPGDSRILVTPGEQDCSFAVSALPETDETPLKPEPSRRPSSPRVSELRLQGVHRADSDPEASVLVTERLPEVSAVPLAEKFSGFGTDWRVSPAWASVATGTAAVTQTSSRPAHRPGGPVIARHDIGVGVPDKRAPVVVALGERPGSRGRGRAHESLSSCLETYFSADLGTLEHVNMCIGIVIFALLARAELEVLTTGGETVASAALRRFAENIATSGARIERGDIQLEEAVDQCFSGVMPEGLAFRAIESQPVEATQWLLEAVKAQLDTLAGVKESRLSDSGWLERGQLLYKYYNVAFVLAYSLATSKGMLSAADRMALYEKFREFAGCRDLLGKKSLGFQWNNRSPDLGNIPRTLKGLESILNRKKGSSGSLRSEMSGGSCLTGLSVGSRMTWVTLASIASYRPRTPSRPLDLGGRPLIEDPDEMGSRSVRRLQTARGLDSDASAYLGTEVGQLDAKVAKIDEAWMKRHVQRDILQIFKSTKEDKLKGLQLEPDTIFQRLAEIVEKKIGSLIDGLGFSPENPSVGLWRQRQLVCEAGTFLYKFLQFYTQYRLQMELKKQSRRSTATVDISTIRLREWEAGMVARSSVRIGDKGDLRSQILFGRMFVSDWAVEWFKASESVTAATGLTHHEGATDSGEE